MIFDHSEGTYCYLINSTESWDHDASIQFLASQLYVSCTVYTLKFLCESVLLLCLYLASILCVDYLVYYSPPWHRWLYFIHSATIL